MLVFVLWLASIPAEPRAAGAGIVWVADSMERVGQSSIPGRKSTIALQAARGEYAPFQLVVRGPEPARVGVSVPELKGPGGAVIGRESFDLYRQDYVRVSRSSPDYGRGNRPLGTGWYPDPLTPLGREGAVEIQGGTNQPIWVDLFVPRAAAPGIYTGNVKVEGAGVSGRVEVELAVWNFTLPARPSLRSSFGIHGPRMKDRATHEELLKHRLMPLVVEPEQSGDLAARLGLNTSALWFASGSDSEACAMQPPPSVAELRRAVQQYPPGLDLYVYVADEIDRCSLLHERVKEWARNVHQAGARTLVTMTPTPALYDSGPADPRPAVDIWVVLPVMHENAPDRIADAQARGFEIWSYNALAQETYSPKWAIDYAPINYRIQPGFLSQSLGYKGVLYWSVDAWTAHPWQDVITHTEDGYAFPGEGMLLYPGRNRPEFGTTPSLRLKWLREGVEDFEYVEILKSMGRGEWALEICRTVARDWKNWSADPARLEAVRRQLGQAIDWLNRTQ